MKIKQMFFGLSLIAATAAFPRSASATLLSFVLSGADHATFVLDSNPTPAGQIDISLGYLDPPLGANNPYFINVPGTLNGQSQTFEYLTFYGTQELGGFSAGLQPGDDGANYFDIFAGGLIFGGTATAPTFAPGIFYFYNADGSNPGIPYDTLTITGVPELSTWCMMILGFISVGALTVRRKRKPLISVA